MSGHSEHCVGISPTYVVNHEKLHETAHAAIVHISQDRNRVTALTPPACKGPASLAGAAALRGLPACIYAYVAMGSSRDHLMETPSFASAFSMPAKLEPRVRESTTSVH